MISLKNLSKRFGSRLAVNDLTLEVPTGSIFGLLGHNGAGKSTTIGCLLGHVAPDAGQIEIGGVDALRHRRQALAQVGAIFESPAFYDYLSGWENLRIFCEYTGRMEPERVAEVLQIVGLEKRIRDQVRTYSHGMKQRLALAQALLPRPKLLILDEPTNGLDPEGIHEMRTLLRRLHQDYGLTMLISSHLLSEIEQLCDHIAVIKEGQLLFTGTMDQIPVPTGWIVLETSDNETAFRLLAEKGLLEPNGSNVRCQLRPSVTIHQVAVNVLQAGLELRAIHPREYTLEEFYLEQVRRVR